MKKLMCHLYFGDPNKGFSLRLAKTLFDSGADMLEIGIPYSDPISDGVVFQAACKRALDGGMSPIGVIRSISQIREMGYRQPIYVTSYYGPIFKMGEEKFVNLVKDVGAQGLIIPDLLFEEQREILKIAKRLGVSIIQFATPYTTDERLQTMSKHARDFLYCISQPAVTGDEKIRLMGQIGTIGYIRGILKTIPLYVGFGISTPEQVRDILKKGADGVIIGSAIARIYEKHLDNPEKSLPEISEFIKSIKKVTIGGNL